MNAVVRTSGLSLLAAAALVLVTAAAGTAQPGRDPGGQGRAPAAHALLDDPEPEPDYDGDGVPDALDNCVDVWNPDQSDIDFDGVGDACDSHPDLDADLDGVPDVQDNCPFAWNSDQADLDSDGIGDVCDSFDDRPDTDGDGWRDADDNCPADSNVDQSDQDTDGIGDACDPVDDRDADFDAVPVTRDNCVDWFNPDQSDVDGDGIGDLCDPVDDRDTVAPEISCEATLERKTPPNHQLVPVLVSVEASDSGLGIARIELTSVTSSQADSGLGRGDRPVDIVGWTLRTDDRSGWLRAEQPGGERTYSLIYQATDNAGNQAACLATVVIDRAGR